MKPTLLILAAGMGSRYGDIKQLDQVGPSGETIMDYSVYDAMKAGYGKIVFVIRKAIEKQFCDLILSKYNNKISCEYVFQELNMLPEGFALPAERLKPWGTAHAILMGAKAIKEPFTVINADDFYGADAFLQMSNYLKHVSIDSNHWAMIGFHLKDTLSNVGFVSRGICSVNKDNMLQAVVEKNKIRKEQDNIVCYDDQESVSLLNKNSLVSMNFWGFTPSLFAFLKDGFKTFLQANIHNFTAEYYIPSVISQQITAHAIEIKVLSTTGKWFGMTYTEEKLTAQAIICSLVDKGIYPKKLF